MVPNDIDPQDVIGRRQTTNSSRNNAEKMRNGERLRYRYND